MAYSKNGRAKSVLTIFRTASRIILGSDHHECGGVNCSEVHLLLQSTLAT